MNKLHFIMPIMRESYKLVLQDLSKQTKLIDELTIVDNGDIFDDSIHQYPFKINLIRPRKNLGTNAVFNMMFDFEEDYIGFVGDDYRLDKRLIECLYNSFPNHPEAGAITASIYKNSLPEFDYRNIKGKRVDGKGHMACIIFKKCILDQIPKIPKQFKIFFGDNYLGWWIGKIGYRIIEIPIGLVHNIQRDLSIKLDYKKVINEERIIWKKWLRNEIEL